jgi:asparagine synthase (glutamine-hydrolysing)
MAHGLESRVPLLDHRLVEFAATMPSNVKFKDGEMKHIFRKSVERWLPRAIVERTDKMGFPTPLTEWVKGEAQDFITDLFSSATALSRDLVDNRMVLKRIAHEPKFGRNIWGMMCLELWQQEFHDHASYFQKEVYDRAVYAQETALAHS